MIIIQFLSIIGALLVFGVIILVHELGHYSAGRLLGFRIDEFAIGFGPKLLKKESKGILYSLRAFPIGGFVKFHGEDENCIDEGAFYNRKPWQRLIAIFSGAFMNIVFAFLCAVFILLLYGSSLPIVEEVVPNAPAAIAGIQPGDVITSTDGKLLDFYNELFDAITASDSSDITLTVRRGDTEQQITVRDFYNHEQKKNILGITVSIGDARTEFTFFRAIGSAVKLIGYNLKEMYTFIFNIFNVPDLGEQIVGPVGTISFVGQAVQQGFESVLSIALLISINLAVFNLLPVPGLDGMRMVFILIEMIFKKPIPREKEGWIHAIGVLLLFGLILLITYGDIRRLFGG